MLRRHVIRPGSRAMAFLQGVCQDAYTRLLQPSLERELRASLTEMANTGAIHNFALNLRPLLLQPPVKDQVTMGLDPGYRNGCKVAVVDGTGKVLDTTVVYPTLSQAKREAAITALGALIRRHEVQCIAIGNGTASRETEEMTSELIARYPGPAYMVVSEAGASVYSASKLAAEEFPQFDVNLRSAVSIARRLQDPLAELVKIDPRAIGVGQYQHDLPQKRAKPSAGRRRGGLRQRRGRGPQYGLCTAAAAGGRSDGGDGKEHRGLPGGKRRVYQPGAAKKGPKAGAKGL